MGILKGLFRSRDKPKNPAVYIFKVKHTFTPCKTSAYYLKIPPKYCTCLYLLYICILFTLITVISINK